MREYYYLTGLKKSPYQLTMADALHLGATGALPTYVFPTEYVTASHPIESKSYFSKDRIVTSKFVKAPQSTVASLEKASVPTITMTHGYLDHRSDGCNPESASFHDSGNLPKESVAVAFASPWLTVDMSDLLCFSDDLEKLASQGVIQRRGEEAIDIERQEYPPHLEALVLAWRKYWKNADPTDRTACPGKDEVIAWLTNQGLSGVTAKAGATIIKPQWATHKGW